MPEATGVLEACEEMYSRLEKEADDVLEQFLSTVETAPLFHKTMERAEGQLKAAERLQGLMTDLELNETVILAEKIENELSAAHGFALGAALAEKQDEWAESLEDTKKHLDKLDAYVRKMKSASGEDSGLEMRSTTLSFRREAKNCQKTLAQLKQMLSLRTHPAFAKVQLAKKRAQKLKATVGAQFDKMVRVRLRRKIASAKMEISNFISQGKKGKIFIDQKHLTLSSNGQETAVAMTQAVRFALEEIANIEKPLARVCLGRAVLVGKYAAEGKRAVLTLGERTVSGDAIIYREQTYSIET